MSEKNAKRLPQDGSGTAPQPEPSTVRPPFDVQEYARESDSMIRIEAAPISARPTAPPPPGMPEYAPGVRSGSMHALGSVASDAVPVLAVAREDLEWFDLTPYARALLRYVDGRETITAICTRARLKLDEAMAALHELARDGVVTLQR